MNRAAAILLTASFCGCTAYVGELPPDDSGSVPIDGPFQKLDAGASELDSLHFKVHAYGPQAAREVSDIAEQAYQRIMVDTNLFSFRPKELYRVVVYATQEEYRSKTAQPDWSGGLSIGNAIYTYQGPQLARVLAHEMTHLIFFEYMGRATQQTRWVNEGLAVYQETKASGGARVDVFAALRGSLRATPLPMSQLMSLVPATERGYTVSAWYAQAESLVRFMIERGGRLGFSQFLEALKDGKDFDAAIAAGFPAAWRSLAELERAWLISLQ